VHDAFFEHGRDRLRKVRVDKVIGGAPVREHMHELAEVAARDCLEADVDHEVLARLHQVLHIQVRRADNRASISVVGERAEQGIGSNVRILQRKRPLRVGPREPLFPRRAKHAPKHCVWVLMEVGHGDAAGLAVDAQRDVVFYIDE